MNIYTGNNASNVITIIEESLAVDNHSSILTMKSESDRPQATLPKQTRLKFLANFLNRA